MMTGDNLFWFIVGCVVGMVLSAAISYVAIRFAEWKDLGEAYQQPQQVRINTLLTPWQVVKISASARFKRFLAMVGIALLFTLTTTLDSELAAGTT